MVLYLFNNQSGCIIKCDDNKKKKETYTWITNGTCESRNLENISENECRKYFLNTNHNVNITSTGPPGCRPILGDKLRDTVKKNSKLKGAGIVYYSRVNDGKESSTDNPCVCKKKMGKTFQFNKKSAEKYKYVTSGTCNSNKLKNISEKECRKHLGKTNHNVTITNGGPRGCWPVLGDSLKNANKNDPSRLGKGFGCYAEKGDGRNCSNDFPCVCK